jgi:hypothetical protein
MMDGIHERSALAMSLLAFSVVFPASARAQLPPIAPAMSAVDVLVGEWSGSGWMEFMPGERSEFRGTERVERRMGGRIVVVEGSFTAWFGPELGEQPVHEAYGIFAHDPASGALTFHTWTAQGVTGARHAVEPAEGAVIWGYEDPAFGTVRFTITVTPDGQWHETGVVSRDGGATWHQFFEMTLQRR